MNNEILVEVAYALPEKQQIIPLKVAEGTTAQQAIVASRVQERFPDLDLNQVKVGIFGKLVKPDIVLREKDRVEIYRPLIADPKEVRRQRAAEGKVMKKGGGDAPGEEAG